MEGHIHHVEHSHPRHTKHELTKTSKSIWRIAGSFLLDMLPIIFGILIAVGINGWRESAHHKQQEHFYLTAIKKNLDETVPDLERDVKFYTEILNAQRFLKRDSIRFASYDSIKTHFYKFFYLVQPQFNNTGFNTLRNTGKMEIITNLDILEHLTRLYENDIPQLGILMQDYNYKYNSLLLPYFTGNNSERSIHGLNNEEIKALVSASRFRNIISLFHLGAIVNNYNKIIKEHKLLSEKIGNELK